MLIPYKWLKGFVEFSLSPEGVAERLTMAGFEVEGAESAEDDIIFEVNVTPNRPDCLSILGIARELAAILQVPLNLPPCQIISDQPESDFSVSILNPDLCNRYAGRVISGVQVSVSPSWMQRRLQQCGIRCINNIVDITNYVLLEFGHPLHAFDADLLVGRKVRIGTPDTIARGSERTNMKTLDGADREIPRDSLLIWDAERPIAVAGVMGGLNTEVSESTQNVFLESAYFNPGSIRRTSKTLGLVSESSYRFERGTDIEFLVKALDRAARLMQEIAGGTVSAIIDEYPAAFTSETIVVQPKKINALLGTSLSTEDMTGILKRLGIPSEVRGNEIKVSPPSHRRDMKRECDVSEEIARIYGYENILTTNPRSPLSSGRLGKKALFMQRIREIMKKAGFTAVINYSFMSMADLDLLGISGSDTRRNAVSISNPLSQDQSFLRTTLAPSLISNFRYNLDRGIKEICLFETACVFTNTGQTLPSEQLRLGGLWYKEKGPSLWKDDASGFYVVKGALELLFRELKIHPYSFIPSSEPFLHGGRSADIVAAGTRIGYLGMLSPQVLSRLDVKKQKPEIVLFELDPEPLFILMPDSIQFKPLAKFPSVERDVAIVLDETIPSSRIQEIIAAFPTSLIEEVTIFDSFKGGAIPEGKRSLAFNIIYRAQDKTLTDEEIEKLHAQLVKDILVKTGGELRT